MKVINHKRRPLYLANNLISKAKEEDISLTPIMLQKLIYFIFRDYYQLTNIALFKEKFETWKYGTALPSIYDYFGIDNIPIKNFYKDENGDINILKLNSDKYLKEAFFSVWNKYKKLSASEMVQLNCAEGTGWFYANKEKCQYIELEFIDNEINKQQEKGE